MWLREAVRSGEAADKGLQGAFLIDCAGIATRADRSQHAAGFPKACLPKGRPISNREPLGLQIPQSAENKHRRTVLIANFGPNHCLGFRAYGSI